MDDIRFIKFVQIRRVKQLDRHGNGRNRAHLHPVHQDGNVQSLGIFQGRFLVVSCVFAVISVVFYRLQGFPNIGVGLSAGQLGHRQLRAGGDARLGAVADLHAIGVARGVYVMGGDGLGDHHSWHTNYVRLFWAYFISFVSCAYCTNYCG